MSNEYDPEIGPNGWDKESIYDNEIYPLMSQIIEICKRENIPMIFSAEYANTDTEEGGSSCCTTHLPGPDGVNERFREACAIIRRPAAYALAVTITTPNP